MTDTSSSSEYSYLNLWTSYFNEPLLRVISNLDVVEMCSLCTISRNFFDTYVGFFTKINHQKEVVYRPTGLSDREFLDLTNPKRGVREKVFEYILHSGLIKDYKKVVNTLSFDEQSFSLVEMACYKGFVNSALYLIIGGFYRKKVLNFALEYCGHSGKTDIVREILKRNVNTQHVNRTLSRCIDKKYYRACVLLLNDYRCCFSFNHSSHIRKIFRVNLEMQKKLINMKKKRGTSKGREKDKILGEIKKELLSEVDRQRKIYEEMVKTKKEGKKINSKKIKKKIGNKGKNKKRGGFLESLSGMESLMDEVDPVFHLMERELEREDSPMSEKDQEKAFRERLERKYNIMPLENINKGKN